VVFKHSAVKELCCCNRRHKLGDARYEVYVNAYEINRGG